VDDERVTVYREIAAGWWEYGRLLSGDLADRAGLERGEPAWAVAACDTVHNLIQAGGDAAVWACVALIEYAPDPVDAPNYVGAGPLEDLVVAHGDAISEALARIGAEYPTLCEARESVWV
jgi:hypothetical protein